MPPRTAYSPVSRTVPVRRKPLISSQATSWSVSTTLPGAAEKVSRAIRARRHALHERIDGRREDARALLGGPRARKPRERRHALRRDAGVRRHAVVGLAIPGREGKHLDLGRDEFERVLERLLALPVAGDVDQHRRPSDRPARPRARSATTSASKPSGTLAASGLVPLEGVEGAGQGRLYHGRYRVSNRGRGRRRATSAGVRVSSLVLGRADARRGNQDESARCASESLEAPEDGRVVIRGRLGLARDPAGRDRGPAPRSGARTRRDPPFRMAPISASAKRPMIRSISRMPRCQARKRIAPRRDVEVRARARRAAHDHGSSSRVAARAAGPLYSDPRALPMPPVLDRCPCVPRLILDPLFAPAAALPGVGPKIAPLLDRLLGEPGRPARVLDLLFHLPNGGIARDLKGSIAEAPIGEPVTLAGHVAAHRPPPRAHRRPIGCSSRTRPAT